MNALRIAEISGLQYLGDQLLAVAVDGAEAPLEDRGDEGGLRTEMVVRGSIVDPGRFCDRPRRHAAEAAIQTVSKPSTSLTCCSPLALSSNGPIRLRIIARLVCICSCACQPGIRPGISKRAA